MTRTVSLPRTKDELLRFIAADAGLSALLEDAKGRLDDDPGHDLAHCLRVALFTMRLGEATLDARAAIAAALLHDVVNVPKDSPERHLASAKSAELARILLPGAGFSREAIDEIASAILTHSFSAGHDPTGPLGDALQDADRLEAVGAIGIMRTVSTGVRMGAKYFHADDPFGSARELDDRAFTIDHFFKKLLLLPKSMKTAAGRREAERRAKHMLLFLEELGEELGVPFSRDSSESEQTP